MIARPILFSGSMIRALLAGTKTQTRRIVKGAPPEADREALMHRGMAHFGIRAHAGSSSETFHFTHGEEGDANALQCPYGVTGDALWAKETWQAQEAFDAMSPTAIGAAFKAEHGEPWCPIRYLADGHCDGSVDQWQESPVGKTRVSIHMPRWASRLTLAITDVRVERLQDISEDDAKAEGIERIGIEYGVPGLWRRPEGPHSARAAYFDLWDHINGNGASKANPFVWCVTFDVIKRNIDEVIRDQAD